MAGTEVSLLGPLAVTISGRPVVIAGPKQRAVLAMLALHANEVVSAATLIDAVWDESPPDGAEHTLQQHVSGLRKLLMPPDLGGSVPILETRSPGYLLRVDALDVDAFERAAQLGFAAAATRNWIGASAAFDDALGHWRGPALADAGESGRLRAAAVRLDEQRLAVVEMRCEARLACGQAREVVPELEHLVAEHPLREGLRAQLMLALYRCGRQADALAAYQAARSALIDELGIEPGAALRELEQAILVQSPTLDVDDQQRVGELKATFRAGSGTVPGWVQLPDGQSVLLGLGTTGIGRDPAAQVRLVDSRVSRHHAEIETVDGQCVVRDLGSTNGTSVNGAPVAEQALVDGDEISIGGALLRFRLTET